MAWGLDPKTRKNLKELGENITRVHQDVYFSMESRVLDQLTEKLEDYKSKPEGQTELALKIAKSAVTIAKGEEALRKKQVELDNALNGKQRKEFTAQMDKGRARLDAFIADTNMSKVSLAALETDLKATRRAAQLQTEKRYGGSEHILRHRTGHKECTGMDVLIKLYKGSTPKADVQEAIASASEGQGTGLGAKYTHALQSFFFKAGDRSRGSLSDEKAEYNHNCDGEAESELVDTELRALCTFACSVFEEVNISEQVIPRFAKFAGGFAGGLTGGAGGDGRKGSFMPGAGAGTGGSSIFTPPPLHRERADSDLRSEKSDNISDNKSDLSGSYSNYSTIGGNGNANANASGGGGGKGASAALSASLLSATRKKQGASGTRVDGTSSPTHTDASGEEDFWTGISTATTSATSGTSATTTTPGPSDGFVFMRLDTLPLQYLAAFRGRSEEALGLSAAGRGGIAPSLLAQLAESGDTPAHIAASLGHLDVLRCLLEIPRSQGTGTGTGTGAGTGAGAGTGTGTGTGAGTGTETGAGAGTRPPARAPAVSSEAVTSSTGQNLMHAACSGGCARTVRYLVENFDFGPEESGS
jgi:hypothetical protein